MAFIRQEFINRITEIGTCEDETQRRDMLAELQDETTSLFDSRETLETNNKNLTDANEKLREANMKLFLRVGESKEDEDEENKGGKNEPQEKPKFEDLFDEKGGIK